MFERTDAVLNKNIEIGNSSFYFMRAGDDGK
jgi:hypothetical protein